MGFKAFIAEEGINEVYSQLRKVQTSILNQEKMGFGFSRLKSIIFSDSFFFYTDSDSKEDLNTLILNMSIQQSILFKLGLPFRGAIAAGEAIIEEDVDKPIFLGQPLIDAYLLEQEINFYGMLIHHTVLKRISEFKDFENHLIAEAEVKLKGTTTMHEIVIPFNLLHFGDPTDTVDNYKGLFNSIRNLGLKSSGVKKAYTNNTLHIYKKLIESKNHNIDSSANE